VIRLNGIGGVTFQNPDRNFDPGFFVGPRRHPERSAAKSKDPVKSFFGFSPGFDSLASSSLSLRPSCPCRGFPAAPFSTSLEMTTFKHQQI
jgi:hypothetical protein